MPKLTRTIKNLDCLCLCALRVWPNPVLTHKVARRTQRASVIFEVTLALALTSIFTSALIHFAQKQKARAILREAAFNGVRAAASLPSGSAPELISETAVVAAKAFYQQANGHGEIKFVARSRAVALPSSGSVEMITLCLGAESQRIIEKDTLPLQRGNTAAMATSEGFFCGE